MQPEAEVAEGLQRLRCSDDDDGGDSASATDGRRVARDGGSVLAAAKRAGFDSPSSVTSEDQYAVQCVSSLDSALGDCFDAIAFTRRLGRHKTVSGLPLLPCRALILLFVYDRDG